MNKAKLINEIEEMYTTEYYDFIHKVEYNYPFFKKYIEKRIKSANPDGVFIKKLKKYCKEVKE